MGGIMATSRLSIGDAIKAGWDKTMSNFFLLCGVVVAAYLMPIVSEYAVVKIAEIGSQPDAGESWFVKGLAAIVGFVLQAAVQMGLIKVTLNLLDKGEADFGDLFDCFPLIINFLLASIIYAAILLVGFILLIIPGIIWAIQFGFFSYAMVDRGLGPIESLKRSSQITRGAKWNILGLAILTCLIIVAGFICFILGIIPASAISVVAFTFAYRQLAADLHETA